jgi:Flp pilus assembly protein TadB
MGMFTAIVGLAIAAYGAYEGTEARKDASKANKSAAEENRKARGEEKALNYQSQAQERRSQVREERVRRARIIQASENGGTDGSSGEYGAVSSLSTGLSANIGMNLGRAQAGNLIGGYLQNAADFNTAAQTAATNAQNADALAGLGMSIFSSAGGFGSFGSPKGK